jgi:hypothetical protein
MQNRPTHDPGQMETSRCGHLRGNSCEKTGARVVADASLRNGFFAKPTRPKNLLQDRPESRETRG